MLSGPVVRPPAEKKHNTSFGKFEIEGKIMKKWDGTPMLEFDEQGHVINQEKKRRGKKKEDGKKEESTTCTCTT